MLLFVLLVAPGHASALTGGPAIQVNSTLGQFRSDPAIATAPDGGFAVAWESYGQDGSKYGVYARRFDASGEPLGGEIAVNTTTAESQDSPAITFDSNGGFVVAWSSSRGPSAGTRIFARRFDASGTPLSGEIAVNVTESAFEENPVIAPDADAGFTVAWQSYGQDGSGWGVYARRFDESDAPLSGEIAVNTTTSGNQESPAISAGPDGAFTIAWSSDEPEESPDRVYFRRFDSSGSPLSSQTSVGPATGEGQFDPAITRDSEGGWDLAWDNTGNGVDRVYARRFDSSGAALGNAALVNPASFYLSGSPQIAASSGGGFFVAWNAVVDCCVGPNQVMVTRFDSAGNALSTAVAVDPSVPEANEGSAISANGTGGFSVAWSREVTNEEDILIEEDIIARQFTVVPETTIEEAPPVLTNDATPDFVFSSDEFGSTFECKVDSGTFSSCTSPLSLGPLTDGHHSFEVRATNPAEATDQSPAKSSFTLDTVAPNAQIDAGPSGPIDETEPSFSFSTDDPEATLECKLDLASYSGCTSPMTVGPLGDGLHSFSVRARDPAGNVDPTPDSRTFTVDTRPPAISFNSGPADGTRTNDVTPSFGFEANEEATFECQLDDGAFEPCSSPYTTEPLLDGLHMLTVSGTDVVGHTSSVSLGFTVDTIPPETSIDSGPADPTRDRSPSFGFSSDEAGSTFECSLDGSAFASCVSPFKTPLLPDGHHSFSVRATDEASNTDPTPAIRSFTIDTTPPDTAIDSGPSSPTNDNTPTFGFSASEPGSTFECSLDAGPYTACATPLTTGALPDGPHSLSVRALDLAVNVDPSPAVRDFTIDTTAPRVKVSAKRMQRAGEPIMIRVACFEVCKVTASGNINTERQATRDNPKARVHTETHHLRIKTVVRYLKQSRHARLRLEPKTKRETTRLTSFVARGIQLTAGVVLDFTDLAGNSRVVRLSIRLGP